MSLDELSLFREVYERRSFTGAARALGIDPSVVSRRVRKLENRLAVALFLRSTRSVSPTDAAEDFYRRIAPALDVIEEAELSATAGGEVLRGPLRVAAPSALGRHRVAPVVHTFCARHPDVEVCLMLSDRRIDLVQEGVDIAIRVGTPRGASLVIRKLGTSAQWLVASPAYLAGMSPIRTAADLAGHRMVLRIEGSLIDYRDNLPEPIRASVGVAFVTDDQGANADAVRAGLGIGVLPAWLVSGDVAAGRLVRPRIGTASFAPPVYAVLGAGRQATGRARALLADLVASWQESSSPA